MQKKNDKKKKKVMIVASVASMIDQFNRENIAILQELEYEVYVGANFNNPGTIDSERNKKLLKELKDSNVRIYDIPFSRKSTNVFSHIQSYKTLQHIIYKNEIDIIHCHSPIVSALARIVGKRLNKKVIYTVHGFHFYKGAPIINWILYYPVEKYLAKFTDVIITINKSDYNICKEKLDVNNVEYIPSTGLDIEKIQSMLSKNINRTDLDLPDNSIIFISVGELNDNKNHSIVIEALADLDNENIYYIICGKGSIDFEKKLLKKVKDLSLENQVKLLGYKENVIDYLANSDVFIFPSKREGLGMAALEAMAVGLPILNSYIGGLKDYTEDGVTGFTFDNSCKKSEIVNSILKFLKLNNSQKLKISNNNKKIAKKFDKHITNSIMREIYQNI